MSVSAVDINKIYDYENITLEILGITKDEGIRDGENAVRNGLYELIEWPDYAHGVYVIDKDGERKDILSIFEEFNRIYTIPKRSMTAGFSHSVLLDISMNQEKATHLRPYVATVCSVVYASWYNTVILDYLSKNQETLDSFRNKNIASDEVYDVDGSRLFSFPKEINEADGKG